MTESTLLMPAIFAFTLLLIGLGLTIWEFYTERNIGSDAVEHVPEVVKPSPEQVRGTRSKFVRHQA